MYQYDQNFNYLLCILKEQTFFELLDSLLVSVRSIALVLVSNSTVRVKRYFGRDMSSLSHDIRYP